MSWAYIAVTNVGMAHTVWGEHCMARLGFALQICRCQYQPPHSCLMHMDLSPCGCCSLSYLAHSDSSSEGQQRHCHKPVWKLEVLTSLLALLAAVTDGQLGHVPGIMSSLACNILDARQQAVLQVQG